MKAKIIFGILAICFLTFVSAELEGSKIYEVTASSVAERKVLEKLAQSGKYDFLHRPKALNQSSHVLVAPKDQDDFESALSDFVIKFNIINGDISKSINLERSRNTVTRALTPSISFNSFQRFDQINYYLDSLAARFPDRVKLTKIGNSYQGRQMRTITISNGDKRANKNVIWVDAGIHAREWVAPAAALYIINQLVENFVANKDLLATYDWVVLPVVNPDGYEYTHTKDRFWRKTMRPSSTSCIGTDPNRNFAFHWGEEGASNLPCDETYKGPSPFSEQETQIVRDELLKFRGRAKFYLTIHAYGSYLLYPWGYTSGLPANVADIDEVARAGARAIQSATGTKYTVGSSTNVLYAAAGGSDDWALGVAGIPISITMELPFGGSGFDPAPYQIQPFVSEAWIGIKAMAQKVITKY